MITTDYYFPIATKGADGKPDRLLGSAFAVAPDGCLVTCRHVVDRVDESGQEIQPFLLDFGNLVMRPLTQARFSKDPVVDLAYLPNALGREHAEFLPILDPEHILIGIDAACYGFLSTNAGRFPARGGYFSGAISSVVAGDRGGKDCLLPYPIVEGMSGAAITTFHNGTKVIGVAHGSQSQRVLASEITEVDDGGSHYKETIVRMIEFGLAHHAQTLIDFLGEVEAEGYVVSKERLPPP